MGWFFVLLFLDPQVDFLTVHGHFLGRVHPNPYLVSFDAEHGHGDFAVANYQALCAPTSQNQHTFLLTQFFRDNSLQKKGTRPTTGAIVALHA